MESAWSNRRPAYRCRHGHTTASSPDSGRPKNAYIREDRIVPHQVSPGDVIRYLRENQITLAYNPAWGPCTREPPESFRSSPWKQANPA
jgi:site-specific DNA recombinase